MHHTFKTPGVVLAVHFLLEVVFLQQRVGRMLEGWQRLRCATITASQAAFIGACSSTAAA